MKFNLILNVTNKNVIEEESIIDIGFISDYEINLAVFVNENFADIIKRRKQIQEKIEDNMDLIDYFEDSSLLEGQLSKRNFMEDIEFISFKGNIKTILKYIKNNPKLSNYKLVLPIRRNLDKQEYNNLIKEIGNKKNFYIYVENDLYPISLSDYYQAVNKFTNILTTVQKYSLSPLEQVLYIYDLVRQRLYNAEKSTDNKHVSRDIVPVLNGTKIVCEGYANLFVTLCNKLGLKMEIYNLDAVNEDCGHARAFGYLEDKKYLVKGIYFFDPTFDNNKGEGLNYLNKYKYFAKTYKQITKEDNNRFTDETCPTLGKNNIEIIKKKYKPNENDYDLIPFFKTINKLNKLINGEDVVGIISSSLTKDELFLKFLNISAYLDKTIDAQIFINAFNQVRKIEFYEKLNSYPYTLYSYFNTLRSSKLRFKNYDEALILMLLFKRNVNSLDIKYPVTDFFIKYIEENKIDKEIQEVKVTALLKQILEKRKEEEKRNQEILNIVNELSKHYIFTNEEEVYNNVSQLFNLTNNCVLDLYEVETYLLRCYYHIIPNNYRLNELAQVLGIPVWEVRENIDNANKKICNLNKDKVRIRK